MGEGVTDREQPQGRKVTLAGPKSDIGRAEKSHKGQNVTLECYNCNIMHTVCAIYIFGFVLFGAGFIDTNSPPWCRGNHTIVMQAYGCPRGSGASQSSLVRHGNPLKLKVNNQQNGAHRNHGKISRYMLNIIFHRSFNHSNILLKIIRVLSVCFGILQFM